MDTTLSLVSSVDFPTATLASRQYIIVDTGGFAAGTPVATQYSDVSGIQLALVAVLGTAVPIGTVVAVAEPLSESTEAGRKYYFLSKFPFLKTLYYFTK